MEWCNFSEHGFSSQRCQYQRAYGWFQSNYYMSIHINHDSGLLNTRKVYSYNNNINNSIYNFRTTSNNKVNFYHDRRPENECAMQNNQGPQLQYIRTCSIWLRPQSYQLPCHVPAQEGDTQAYGSVMPILSGDNLRTPIRTPTYSSLQTNSGKYLEHLIEGEASSLISSPRDWSATAFGKLQNWSSNWYNRTIEPPTTTELRRKFQSFHTGKIRHQVEQTISHSRTSTKEQETTHSSCNLPLDYQRRSGKHNLWGMLLYNATWIPECRVT